LRSGEKLNLAVAGHTDNLSSIAVITDESGAVAERLSYDAWGKRRFPNGADDPSGNLNSRSQTTRGFTGQEELADVGLVHLNGRVYDPLVGRMMSADPFVPDPLNGQAWNRYSYVINNPLAFTDPNGYCFLGMCSWGKAISTFLGRTFGVLFREFPILGDLLEIAARVHVCAVRLGVRYPARQAADFDVEARRIPVPAGDRHMLFCEPVFPHCRTGLLQAETEIGKTRAETGAARPPVRAGNPENPSPETRRLRPNSRKCRGFSYIEKCHRRDRTGWLGREDSNLGIAVDMPDNARALPTCSRKVRKPAAMVQRRFPI